MSTDMPQWPMPGPTKAFKPEPEQLDENCLTALPRGIKIQSITPSGASAWVQTVKIEALLEDGSSRDYFKKSQTGLAGRRMMEGTFEAESLYYNYAPSNVPKPISWGCYALDPDTWFYLCEFHEMDDEVPEAGSFVSIISNVHKSSMGHSPGGKYGFHVPTHLANIPNDNTWQETWEAFYTQLMNIMFIQEESVHGTNDEDYNGLKRAFFEKVIPRLLRPLETGGRSIEPCLVHSDLWPGNCMPDADTGSIMIFDACTFWGHNEADLGSWRAPRYRMGRPFFKQYIDIVGRSEPQADWDDRNALYAIRYDLLVSALYPNDLVFREMAKDGIRRLVEKHPHGLEGFDEEV